MSGILISLVRFQAIDWPLLCFLSQKKSLGLLKPEDQLQSNLFRHETKLHIYSILQKKKKQPWWNIKLLAKAITEWLTIFHCVCTVTSRTPKENMQIR